MTPPLCKNCGHIKVNHDPTLPCGCNDTCECQFFVPPDDDEPDRVNHPAHYTFGRFEVLEVIADWCKGLPAYEAICFGHIIRYTSRAQHKFDKLEDLKKAQFYLSEWISEVESK